MIGWCNGAFRKTGHTKSWLTWLAAQLTQLLIFWCITMSMEPQQTHTERDELYILSTWMQGYRMVNKAVQCAVIFWLSFRCDQWEQDWQGMEATLLEVSIAQVEVHRTWLCTRVSGQRERSAVECTQRLYLPNDHLFDCGKVGMWQCKKNQSVQWIMQIAVDNIRWYLLPSCITSKWICINSHKVSKYICTM